MWASRAEPDNKALEQTRKQPRRVPLISRPVRYLKRNHPCIGEIITAIGGSAVLFAAQGWVTRSIILHLLCKDIETFKAQLQMESQREMTHLKSSLELAAFEHQTRFSRLHEKRAEIIANLYGKTVDLHKAVSDFVRQFLSVDDSTKEIKLRLLWET